jgi:hypothetical protein
MNKSIGALSALLAVAALLVACNGSNGGSPAPAPSGTCGGPPNKLEVLYPIPNTKNAPQNLPFIYVSTKGSLPPSNSFNFLLAQSNGNSTFTSLFGQISVGQIPTPHATPSYSGAVYYASQIPPSYLIGPDQSVSLFWNDGGTNCSPHFLVSSFSTQ